MEVHCAAFPCFVSLFWLFYSYAFAALIFLFLARSSPEWEAKPSLSYSLVEAQSSESLINLICLCIYYLPSSNSTSFSAKFSSTLSKLSNVFVQKYICLLFSLPFMFLDLADVKAKLDNQKSYFKDRTWLAGIEKGLVDSENKIWINRHT